MAFDILRTRSADEEPDSLYPLPGSSVNTFLLEPGDRDGSVSGCGTTIGIDPRRW